jgi:probable FeS assembly SUF system protein SufT
MGNQYGEVHEVALTRDCPAVIVPWGTHVVLEAGSPAQITQRLGSTFTVVVGGNLYRIDGKEADALGLEAEAIEAAAHTGEPFSAEQVQSAAWEQLATCYDPEIPIDIVNLGLVYSCEVLPLQNNRFRIEVKMTLTAAGCGMGTMLADEARSKLLAIQDVDEVDVDLVWDPPWDREMMSETARLEMGMM